MPIRPGRDFSNPELRKEKLEQSILFFLHVANNEHLGRMKLMKLLYYADFDHYEQYERPLTGARYRKLPHGPVPDDATAVLEEMERARRIQRRDVRFADGKVQHRFETAEQPDLSLLTPSELDTLHQVARRWESHTTKQIEAATHGEAPWIAVRHGEVIPYYLAHYRNNFGAMTLDDDELAEQEAQPDEEEVFAL